MHSESQIIDLLREAYISKKRSIGAVSWKQDKTTNRILRAPIACECVGSKLTGVSIISTAWQDEPEARVTFQLLCDIDGTDFPVARIDWRPRQPHTNRLGPPGLRGLTAYTSIHDFPENAALGLSTMKERNLPIIKEIVPEPLNFNELLVYLSETFKLEGASDIPVPPWTEHLL